MRSECVETFIDDLFMWHVARRHRKIGKLIERTAFDNQALDGRRRVGSLQQWPIRASLDALEDHITVSAQPDRYRLVVNPVARPLTHKSAAAGRDHARTALEQAGDHTRFTIAKIRLAVLRENFADRQARMRDFDFLDGYSFEA